jgi:hypothetical protein
MNGIVGERRIEIEVQNEWNRRNGKTGVAGYLLPCRKGFVVFIRLFAGPMSHVVFPIMYVKRL